MSTPFSYSRRLKPYAEQVRADEQRRARNRLIAAVIVMAVIFWWLI